MIPNSIRSVFPSRVAAYVALFVSLALVLASSALAQLTTGGGTIISVTTDANVVSSELSRHLPASGIRKYTRSVGFLRLVGDEAPFLFGRERRVLQTR